MTIKQEKSLEKEVGQDERTWKYLGDIDDSAPFDFTGPLPLAF
jgi:hypothetical protein